MTFSTAANSVAWNGPICPTCGARYLGAHTCSREDLQKRIIELAQQMVSAPSSGECLTAGTRNCPCRPENGGSGICGCVLGGPQITCSTPPLRSSMGDRDDEPNSTHQRARRQS